MAASSNFALTIQLGDHPTRYMLDHLPERAAPLFQRFMDRTAEISALLNTEKDPEVAVRVATFALHFLSRGSITPILTDFDKLQRSPLDYLKKEEFAASYYRGDGSSIFHLFKDACKELFNGVNLEDKYHSGLIKPNRFSIAMQRACEYSSITYHQTSLPSIPDDIDNHFFDITTWLQETSLKGWPKTAAEWNILYLDITEKLDSIEKNCFIGGVFRFNDDVGLYIFFYKDPSEPISECIVNMLNYRGNVGSYPEMIAMKRALVKVGVKVTPEATKPSRQDAYTYSIPDALKTLRNVEDGPFDTYRDLHVELLKHIDCSQLQGNHQSSACERIYEICTKLATNALSFQETVNAYHLLMEEIILIHSLSKPERLLNQIIQASLPVSNDIAVLTYNSGMACFDYIVEAVRKEYPSDKRPVLSIMQGSYYELQEELRWLLSEMWKTEVIENEESTNTPDLLILDLYPNNVTLEEARVNPVVKLVNQAISKRKDVIPPLTVVLDTSTTLLTEPAIWDIKDELKPLISEGKVRLILASSLAKFYSCGFDKYTGGAIVCFEEEESPLLKQLKTFANRDRMSEEAECFFSFLLSQPDKITNYYTTTLENTRALYEQIEGLAQQKDPQVPVIGIPRPEGDAKEIEGKIIETSGRMRLPLFIRASFPFPHSGVVECGHYALRLTAGLDVRNNAKQYAQLFEGVHSAK